MKKSVRKIEQRTRGRDNGSGIATLLFNQGDGHDRMRWRTRSENISKKTAANDETANAWRVAA